MGKVWKYAFIASLSGFLFGFDTAVISGADQTLQNIWESSDFFHGFVVIGIALWGTVLGALFGAFPTNKFGRRNSLIAIAILYLISAIGSALASDPYFFSVFRFLGGLAIGISTISAPAYITEISPDRSRGRLVGFYQLNIVVGILIALLSNYYIVHTIGETSWRWMLGAEVIPAIIFLLLSFLLPFSPFWLKRKGKLEKAEVIANRLGIVINEFDEQEKKGNSVFQKAYRASFYLVILIAFFNQFSGINAVLYYAPRIFKEAGLALDLAFMSTAGIGLVNLAFTLIGMYLIDKWGRKKLLYLGGIGYILSLSFIALAFSLGLSGKLIVGMIFVFIASHAIGQGVVIWVFIAELFPVSIRASGQSLGCSVHWVLAAIIPSFMPYFFNLVGVSWVFSFFAAMMILQMIWIYYKVPETKGKSSSEIQALLN